jgi:protein-L-isoaspartate(D-aspartate) O-methyltransferase
MNRPHPVMVFFTMTILISTLAPAFGQDHYRGSREQMIKEIEADVRMTSRKIGRKRLNAAVMKAMATVPRHHFVPAHLKYAAYENRPLPIGHGQTISQPYIVALMTDLLDVHPSDVILEIGTGSGYQAAILGTLVEKVFTIEIIRDLAEKARRRLSNLGYDRVHVYQRDGYYGLKERAPFDGIMVTAAARSIPPPLIQQLKPGGRMVIPVGNPFMTQQLMVVEKRKDGKITTSQILPVIFVPLTGGH